MKAHEPCGMDPTGEGDPCSTLHHEPASRPSGRGSVADWPMSPCCRKALLPEYYEDEKGVDHDGLTCAGCSRFYEVPA